MSHPHLRSLGVAFTLGISAALAPRTAQAQARAPRTGDDVLALMANAYRGKWYRTLTFVQQTIIHRPDGTEQLSTWYEAVRAPDRLRIDFGDPKLGNGALYTADSLYRVTGGKITRTVGQGNPFLPFVIGIYTQPLAVSRRQMAPWGFDLSRLYVGRWRDRPVYVVGARDTSDVTSPQFWVDRERLVAVRILVPLSAGGKVQDIHLDNYVKAGGGWLATTIDIREDGVSKQREEYGDWVVEPKISNEFFVAEQWGSVPHWGDASASIRAELDSTAAGWNRGDLARYLAAYTDSATAMGADGPARGRSAIEAQMRSGFWKSGRPDQMLHYEHVEIRMLGLGNALVTGQFVLTGAGRQNRTGWFTTIWSKTPAGWRMIHDHSG